MSQLLNVIILIALLVPLWRLLRRDFLKGLAYGVFLCVSMPTVLRLPLPGSLPQLTIYRLILICVFIAWFGRRSEQRRATIPLLGTFVFWGLTNLVSLLFTSGTFVVSLKRYLDYVLETAVFFVLLTTSLQSKEDALKILRAAWLGVSLVAMLAFVEKYTRFNPVHYLTPGGGADIGASRDVTATYQHRILLGTGMAMGWPLALAMMFVPDRGSRRRLLLWGSVALLMAGCYFGNSRGPWLASAFAAAALLLVGGRAIRRRFSLVLVATVLVLVARPGVVEMLTRDAAATQDSSSFKGGTYRYRLELWKVAWAEISRSPVRLLFGCGPGCGLGSTVDWSLSYRGGEDWEIWSWDNQLAYDLYQSGVLGFCASLMLYGGALLAAFAFWRRAAAKNKAIHACLLATILAYDFMLTNVLMYAKPVNFLFWTTIAVTCVLGLRPHNEKAVLVQNGESEEQEELEAESTLSQVEP